MDSEEVRSQARKTMRAVIKIASERVPGSNSVNPLEGLQGGTPGSENTAKWAGSGWDAKVVSRLFYYFPHCSELGNIAGNV